jgi:hypothetical protein
MHKCARPGQGPLERERETMEQEKNSKYTANKIKAMLLYMEWLRIMHSLNLADARVERRTLKCVNVYAYLVGFIPV